MKIFGPVVKMLKFADGAQVRFEIRKWGENASNESLAN
jgi:hypothetical protein